MNTEDLIKFYKFSISGKLNDFSSLILSHFAKKNHLIEILTSLINKDENLNDIYKLLLRKDLISLTATDIQLNKGSYSVTYDKISRINGIALPEILDNFYSMIYSLKDNKPEEANHIFERYFLNKVIIETQRARLYIFIKVFLEDKRLGTVDKQIIEREIRKLLNGLSDDNLIELYYDSGYDNFKMNVKLDASIEDDAFWPKLFTPRQKYLHVKEKRRAIDKVDKRVKDLANLDITEEENLSEEQIEQELKKLELDKKELLKVVEFKMPVDEILPEDVDDFKDLNKDNF